MIKLAQSIFSGTSLRTLSNRYFYFGILIPRRGEFYARREIQFFDASKEEICV